MAGVASLKSRKSASITKILHEISYLNHIRQPAVHNAG